MPESLAYLSGRYIPNHELVIPVSDAGFMLGATVSEQLRTFGGKLFRLDDHLKRLFHSLEIVGVDPGLSRDELAAVAEKIAAHNCALLDPADDIGVSMFVTPGAYTALGGVGGGKPLIGVHARPLAFGQWAKKYESGEALATTDVEQVPVACWPPELKCRSRMHYYLAERKAQAIDPESRALMHDSEGNITETTIANILVWSARGGLVTPPKHKVLPGVSLATVIELAKNLGLEVSENDLTAETLKNADEVLVSSTSPCILPATRINRRAIGIGKPGPIFRQLLDAWSELVGVDIAQQAERFSNR